jgi:hypothetical protein
MAGRLAEYAAVKAATKRMGEATEKEGADLYDQFRKSGFQLAPEAAPQFSSSLRTDLNQRGFTDVVADQTHRVLDGFERRPFTTPQEFHAAYQELGNVARGATNANERFAASIAQERLLGFLENTPPQFVTGTMRGGAAGQAMPASTTAAEAAATLQQANADWAAAQRAKNVSGRITKAEQVAAGQHSGLGLENELRRRIGVLADPTARSRGFTPEELQAFEQFNRGSKLENIRRWAMNLGGGRGGIATTIAGGTAGYFGGSDPVTGTAYGVGFPLAALGLAKYGNMRALGRARDLELMLLSRSPYAARVGVPGTRAGTPLTTLAPTLATVGQ